VEKIKKQIICGLAQTVVYVMVLLQVLVSTALSNSGLIKSGKFCWLLTCAKELGLKNGLVITKSKEGAETIDGIRVRFVPLWKWLLE